MDQSGNRLVQMEEELDGMNGSNGIGVRIAKVEKEIEQLEDQMLEVMEKQQELLDLEQTTEVETRSVHLAQQLKKLENLLTSKGKMLEILQQKER